MDRWMEFLELRQLLSAGSSLCSEGPAEAAHVLSVDKVRPAAAFNPQTLVGTYSGKVTIHISTAPGLPAVTQQIPATIVVQSVDAKGRVRGTITSSPTGTIPFNVKQSKINKDRTFVLKYNKNGIDGVLQGTYVRGTSLTGDFSGTVNGYDVDGTFNFKK